MNAEGHRKYSAGFLFRRDRVLLVRKSHPRWQAGMMNAIGGEFEKDEDASAAMCREFKEEANYATASWQFFASEYGPGYEVHFFRHQMRHDDQYVAPKANDKGEELEWCDPNGVKYPVIGNLNWLLPLAQDPRPLTCVVRTEGDIRKLVTW